MTIGLLMTLTGLVLFYSLDNIEGLESTIRSLKNGGTFFGLMGIGVTVAGFLLYLIGRT